ncbi:MAG: hypothetical protein J6036_03090 [Clostridia bacterium]|nr:hypothetical protein [Clostridia bacterium]
MTKGTIGLRVLLIAFILCISSIWILWIFLGRFVDQTNYENRELAEKPTLNFENYMQFPEEYNSYFNDNFPFRKTFVSWNSTIDLNVFKKASNERVILGSDNWLFYGDASDGDPIACYQGENLLSDEELEALAENCMAQKEYLESLGKEFVIFIAPNKERVYYEYLPKRYGEPAENYRALQIVNYLRDNTDIRVVYPYDDIMAAKEYFDHNIYYKTDTHWNYVGAYVGSCALLKELGIEMPAYDSDKVMVRAFGNTAGDLAGFLGLHDELEQYDSEYFLMGYNFHGFKRLGGDYEGIIACSAEGADERKLLIIRDSFCTAMIQYVGSQFNQSRFRHNATYTYDDFTFQDPDIVVYETVERYAGNLATFSLKRKTTASES